MSVGASLALEGLMLPNDARCVPADVGVWGAVLLFVAMSLSCSPRADLKLGADSEVRADACRPDQAQEGRAEREGTTDMSDSLADGLQEVTKVDVAEELEREPDADSGGCMPDCLGKECGNDGCGGVCGLCDDGNNYTFDECMGTFCTHQALWYDQGTCCQTDEDCDDGWACTASFCRSGTGSGEARCVGEPRPGPDCCLLSADCPEGFRCLWFQCLDPHEIDCYPKGPAQQCTCGHVCRKPVCESSNWSCACPWKTPDEQKLEGLECCFSDGDCAAGGIWEEDSNLDGQSGPDDPSTVDACLDNQCQHFGFPAQCECGTGNPLGSCDDGNDCTIETGCTSNCACAHEVDIATSGCCETSLDCPETFVSGEIAICSGHVCYINNIDAFHCSPDWVGSNWCTYSVCIKGQYLSIPAGEALATGNTCCVGPAGGNCGCGDGVVRRN